MSPCNGKIAHKLTASIAACHDGGKINRPTDPSDGSTNLASRRIDGYCCCGRKSETLDLVCGVGQSKKPSLGDFDVVSTSLIKSVHSSSLFRPDGKHQEERLRGLLVCHLLKLLFVQQRDDPVGCSTWIHQMRDSQSVD